MERTRSIPCDGSVSRVAWSPDGRMLAFTSSHGSGELHVVAVDSGERVWSATAAEGRSAIAFSLDGRALAWGGHGGVLELRAAADGAVAWRAELQIYAITSLAWLPGHKLAIGEHAIRGDPANVPAAFRHVAGVQIRNAVTGAFETRLAMRHVVQAITAHGDALYAVGHVDEVAAFDVGEATVAPRWTATVFPSGAFGAFLADLAVAPDGQRLAVTGSSLVRLVGCSDGKRASRPVKGIADDSIAVAWAPRGIAVGFADGNVVVLDGSTLKPTASFAHPGRCFVRWSPDGTTLAVAGHDVVSLFT